MTAEDIARKLLGLVKKAEPGAHALASVELGRSAHTRYAVNEITTAGDTDAGEIEVTVAFGQRHARASSTRLDDDGLSELVARAVAMARLSPEDPEWMPLLGPQQFRPAGATYDAATAELGAEARAEVLKKAIAAAKDKGVVGAGFYRCDARERVLASSAGLSATHRFTHVSFSSTARSPDGTGSGWDGVAAARASEIDPVAIASAAADKAVRSQKPRDLEPGKYTVVLEPGCVSVLMGYFAQALDARQADEGRSFFTKPGGGSRIGEDLFAKGLTFKSDPFDAETPASPFDAEGLALAPTTWAEGGKLLTLSRTRYWAKLKGGAPTGRHAAFHLKGAGGKSQADLVRGVDRGLLVTRFWYVRWLDPKTMTVTGLTRDGVFLIEKGAVTAPVKNFRFNDSPARVLQSATGWTSVTQRVPVGGVENVVRVPALVAHEFLMASTSQAV
jgi:predicted Zn-dependent protease